MTGSGERLLESAQEAVEIARGERPAASIRVAGHTYVPREELDRVSTDLELAVRTIEALRTRLGDPEGTIAHAEVIERRSDAAERECARLRRDWILAEDALASIAGERTPRKFPQTSYEIAKEALAAIRAERPEPRWDQLGPMPISVELRDKLSRMRHDDGYTGPGD